MPTTPPLRDPFTAWGNVAFLRFVVDAPTQDAEQRLWAATQDARQELESITRDLVRRFLGTSFEVEAVRFDRGSIHIFIVIAATYHGVSRYKSLIEGLNLLVSHLRQAIRAIFQKFGAGTVMVYGDWLPGP